MKTEEVTRQAHEKAEKDGVRESLERIVAERKKLAELTRAQANAATAPVAEATRAEADLAEAEMRLAVRKEEILKAGSNAELDRLNRETRELVLERDLDETRLRVLETKLKSLRGVMSGVDDYNDANDRILMLGREIERLESTLLQSGL